MQSQIRFWMRGTRNCHCSHGLWYAEKGFLPLGPGKNLIWALWSGVHNLKKRKVTTEMIKYQTCNYIIIIKSGWQIFIVLQLLLCRWLLHACCCWLMFISCFVFLDLWSSPCPTSLTSRHCSLKSNSSSVLAMENTFDTQQTLVSLCLCFLWDKASASVQFFPQ